ncbi:hypothetical protein [Erythrobacter sp.]|uniref:hypothetical protein n=1 Tax=Erythrobacter sp. TaxID=1042 RepID=UPI0025F06961|nr:hypothetical protein [Erythrobacter sp.]
MPTPDRRTRIDQDDAKAGTNEGVVRWVLLISTALAIIALTIIWVTGALSEGEVESEATVTERIEERADDEGIDRSMDGINPEVGDEFTDIPDSE